MGSTTSMRPTISSFVLLPVRLLAQASAAADVPQRKLNGFR